MVDTKKLSYHGNTRMVAHMGAASLEPENTIAAFIASCNRSYYGIETDVHVTKDKKVVCIHDSNTERVAGVKVMVEESNFDDLRKISLFDHDKVSYRVDLHIPSLAEYINICKKYGKIAVLELKNKMDEEDVYMIYDEIEALGYNDSTIYISFAIENLHAIRRKNSEQTVQYLTVSDINGEVVEQLKNLRYDLNIHCKLITKELIDTCHKNGIAVNTWTVDDIDVAEDFIGLGIDYITSNAIE